MDYTYGHVGGMTVRRWLTENVGRIRSVPYVLISSVDSCLDVTVMPWAQSRLVPDTSWALSVSPLVVSGASVVQLLDDASLFTGFDEIWLPARLPVGKAPGAAHLVAPRRLDRQLPLPSAIAEWLAESGCRLGVGDGDGMNYVGDRGLGRQLELV